MSKIPVNFFRILEFQGSLKSKKVFGFANPMPRRWGEGPITRVTGWRYFPQQGVNNITQTQKTSMTEEGGSQIKSRL